MAAKSSDEESQFEKNVVTRNGLLLAPALHEVICLCDRNAEIGNIKLLRETLDRVL